MSNQFELNLSGGSIRPSAVVSAEITSATLREMSTGRGTDVMIGLKSGAESLVAACAVAHENATTTEIGRRLLGQIARAAGLTGKLTQADLKRLVGKSVTVSVRYDAAWERYKVVAARPCMPEDKPLAPVNDESQLGG
jgi:hypothetical protein